MTIHRNIDGKELSFELSKDEIYEAYYEAQEDFDVEDVSEYTEEFLERYNENPDNYSKYNEHISEDDVMEHIYDIAREYRQLANQRFDWQNTADEAFRRVLF